MPRLTRKSIIQAVSTSLGVKAEHVEIYKALESDGGTYYWSGNAGVYFTEANTHMQKLSDTDLDGWVEDFKLKMAEVRPYDWDTEGFTGADFNRYIESESY